jgi:hypothetical protein
MRKLAILLAVILLASCTEVILPPPANVHVYDSSWSKVAEATKRASSRDIDDALTLEAFVDEYNAAHTDDQLFLVEGSEVPIEEAPPAMAYIVNATSLEIYWASSVARVDLVDNREAWRMSVLATADPSTGQLVPCTLYVDNVPPEPPIIIPPEPQLWTALVDSTTSTAYYSELSATEAAAISRYQAMVTQAALENAGLGSLPPGVYVPYRGAKEYGL